MAFLTGIGVSSSPLPPSVGFAGGLLLATLVVAGCGSQGGHGTGGKGGTAGNGGTTGRGGAAGMGRDAAPDVPADVQGDLGSDAATCGVIVSPVILFGSLNPGESQQLPAIAFDGTNYLAVWQQGLSPGTNWRLYGSRVSREGVVLDASPFLISDPYSVSPAVAFNGTDFDVIWDDHRASSYQIYGARVTTGGTVRDPAGILIEALTPGGNPAIACGTDGCLATWRYLDGPASNLPEGIYGTRLDGSLTTLDSPRIPVAVPADCTRDGGDVCPFVPTYPNAVAAGSDYFVTWADGKQIGGAKLSTAGVVSGSSVSIAGPSSWPDRAGLAFGETELFVTWLSRLPGDGGAGYEVDGSRVAGTSVLDSPAVSIATADVVDSPATVFDGRHFMTVWAGGAGQPLHDFLAGARVTTAGALVDNPAFSISEGDASYGQMAAIASSGQGSSLAAYVSCTQTSAATDCRVRAYILQDCP